MTEIQIPRPENMFSRESAISRLIRGAQLLNIAISSSDLPFIKDGNNILESGLSKLELREVKGNWYSLIYDESSQYHYYIGIDGTPIVVDYDTNFPEIGPGIDSDLIIKETKGYSSKIHDDVTRLTDAAFASLTQIQTEFENSTAVSYEDFDLQRISNMTTAELLTFMKTLSGNFATHLTRIGIREVSGIHSAGQGVYFTAAQELFRAGALLSPLALSRSAGSTAKIFSAEGSYEHPSGCIHLAPQLVDMEYVAETENIPFIMFSAEVIMMLRAFSSHWLGFSTQVTGGYANWEIAGMAIDPTDSSYQLPINAGIVFLPKSTKVDPKTGSKYEVMNGKGVFFEARAEQLRTLLNLDKSDEIFQTLDQIANTYREKIHTSRPQEFRAKFWNKTDFDGQLNDDQRASIESLIPEWKDRWDNLESEWKNMDLGWKRVFLANFDRELAHLGINYAEVDLESLDLDTIKTAMLYTMLNQAHALYEPAKETVTSQEFWETWFQDNGSRPPRVVYYDGDPNVAIANLLLEHKVIEPNEINRRPGPREGWLDRRFHKLIIPPSTGLDIGNFRIHEWGNWMLRIAKNID